MQPWELPLVDEHALEIDADRERVWQALLAVLPGALSVRGTRVVATLLGCRERWVRGDLQEVGSTLVGFRVVRAERQVELALGGEHRFSRYALIFTIDDRGSGRSRLRATTRAAFPGIHGRTYRGLVIGSGAHIRVVRAILAAVKARAIHRPRTRVARRGVAGG